jgi:hypothetical protein
LLARVRREGQAKRNFKPFETPTGMKLAMEARKGIFNNSSFNCLQFASTFELFFSLLLFASIRLNSL